MSRRVTPASRGFSLVELLPALAIGLVVVVTAFLLYGVAMDTLGSRNARVASADLVDDALDALQADLFRALPEVIGDDPAWQLSLEDESSLLRFYTLRSGLSHTSDPLRWLEPVAVEWRLASDAKGRRRLLQSTRPARGPGATQPAVSNVLAEAGAFLVELENDGEWKREWTEKDEGSPRAARVRLDTGKGVQTVEFLIPSGLSVTSRIIRAKAPGESP